jgi:hypothetical protein
VSIVGGSCAERGSQAEQSDGEAEEGEYPDVRGCGFDAAGQLGDRGEQVEGVGGGQRDRPAPDPAQRGVQAVTGASPVTTGPRRRLPG